MNIREATKNAALLILFGAILFGTLIGIIALTTFVFHAAGVALAILVCVVSSFVAVFVGMLLIQWDDNRQGYGN